MKIQVAEAFRPLFKPKRFKVFYGGRGGSKSWAFAQALELLAAKESKRILCTRELQGSIQESVHRLLSDTVDRLGLNGFYEIQNTVIRGKNESNFIFEGLKNNTTKIKSMEGVDVVWCEEAEAISERSWDLLIPTIRKTGSEIWISFNPADEMDATYQRFVKPYEEEIMRNGFYEDDNIYVAKVGYADNPWFPEELRLEMEECKRLNPKKWAHIWDGQCNADYKDSIIQPEWVDAAIDAHKKLGFKKLGAKVLGFDPADEGSDAKAVAIRHGSIIESVEQWLDGNISDAIDRAFNTAFDSRCTDIVYDSVGVGAAIKVGLSERVSGRNIDVSGFGGGDGVHKPDYEYKNDRLNKQVFKNKRAQYWWFLRDRFENTYNAIEKGEYIDPDYLISLSSGIKDLSLLKSELCRVQRKRSTANTLIQLESKPEMAKRGVKSPNMADALVMCFANKDPIETISIDFASEW